MAKNANFDTVYSALDDLNTWRPGIRQAPLASGAALALALVGILLSATILAVSDGRTLESWESAARFTPATYLSISSTITNITLHFALDGGINVSWWRRALRPNTRIVDLHRIWSYGDSFFAALVSFRNFNIIAVASILVTLAPINGPLLQRASRVITVDIPVNRTLSLQIATQLPDNFTGYITGHSKTPALLTPQFANVVQGYYRQDTIQSISSCRNTCKSHVLGAGWSTSCERASVPYNMSTAMLEINSPNGTLEETSPDATLIFTPVFNSSFQWSAQRPVILQAVVSFKAQTGCIGELVQRTCTLVAATVEYPVEIRSNSTVLDPGSTIWDDVQVGPVANGSVQDDVYEGKTTYGGLYWALNSRFESSMQLSWAGVVGYEIKSNGELASAYATNVTNKPDCDIIFTDPMDDMLAGARELMFRAAVDVGIADSSLTEYIPATETTTHNIYKSNYLFFAIATALSMLGILSVVGTFNGFWQLGRSVSLSPVETAKAFNAPILSNNDSNATVWDLLEEVGTRPVQYGAVAVVTDNVTRRNGLPREISFRRKPHPESILVHSETGDRFLCDLSGLESRAEAVTLDEGQPLLRLQLANPGIVKAPQRDGRYIGYSQSDALGRYV